MGVNTEKSRSRIIYLDLIRIFAIFAVINIHICACDWARLSVLSFDWQVLNFYDATSRWCIPVFIMISGELFLRPEKKIEFGSLLKKNVLRMLVSLIFWAEIYYLFQAFLAHGRIGFTDLLYGLIAVFTFKARRHLWFLYMIIGLYLLTPIIRKFTAGKTLSQLLAFSVTLISISGFLPLFVYFSPLKNPLTIMQGFGFVGLFILGYCISCLKIKGTHTRILYIAGFAGVIFTIAASSILSVYEGAPDQLFYQNTAPNVVITAISILVFGKSKLEELSFGEKWNKNIAKFSGITFTVYLIHDFFVIPFEQKLYGFTPISFNPVFAVPFFALIIYCISAFISYFLCRTPFINKYIT